MEGLDGGVGLAETAVDSQDHVRGFFFSSRRRHTRSLRDWSSDVCSSDLAGLGSLVLVLLPVFGVAENGSRRWLLLGPITVQASEPARLFLLLYLAGYAVRRSTQLGESLNGLEIGRASCRERVWVVGGAGA